MAQKYIVMKLQKASNILQKKHVPILPRIIFLLTRLLCGCSIPPSVEIGKNTRFAHNGLGVVVHHRCVIGHDTVIQANVVIGGKEGKAPVIGNYCYIGAGAIILGGVTLGDDVIIGANAVVTHDVEPGKVVMGVPAKVVKEVDPSLIGVAKH